MGLVKTYEVDKSCGTLVVVIPKMAREKLKIKRGIRFHVKVDGKGRIIYERLE